jgi:cystathionine gamma-lyase
MGEYKVETLAVHAGYDCDNEHASVMPAINLSTTFKQMEPGVHKVLQLMKGFEYARSANPTRTVVEKAIAELEGANYALAFSSGSAVTSTIGNLFPPGSHVICMDDVYGGTNRYFRKVGHLKTEFVDLTDLKKVEEAMKAETMVENADS